MTDTKMSRGTQLQDARAIGGRDVPYEKGLKASNQSDRWS